MIGEYRQTQAVVIGSGLCGLAAACRLLQEKVQVLVLGPLPGNLALAAGSLDFLECLPGEPDSLVENPWQALARLRTTEPQHPYAVLGDAELRAAWEGFAGVLAQTALYYRGGGEKNLLLPTSWGAVRPTYLLPKAMHTAAKGLRRRTPALIADFKGMQEFNARLMVGAPLAANGTT